MSREIEEARRVIGLRQALIRAQKFSRAWKRLAYILEVDLRVARDGGAALAQEAHELRQQLRKEGT